MSYHPGYSLNDSIPVDSYEGDLYRSCLLYIWDFIAQIKVMMLIGPSKCSTFQIMANLWLLGQSLGEANQITLQDI